MSFSIPVSILASTTAEATSVRAMVAVALAIVALLLIDRMKPATPKRPIAVPVERKPTPLYREPERDERMRTVVTLSGGAVVAGAVVACLLGFALTIALELVGGLLRS